MGVKWNLIVVLLYISLVTSDVKLLFMYLLDVFISLKKCLFVFFPFQRFIFILFVVELCGSLYILNTRLFSDLIFSEFLQFFVSILLKCS